MEKFIFFIFLFSQYLQQIPNPLVAHTQNQAYNNFWDGAVGGKGYWGGVVSQTPDIFTSHFDKEGIKNVYQLNSLSPYASQVNTGGFDSMVPYYTPYGASQYNYVPTKSNFMSNSQLGSFSYDINEPRYQQLYKEYYNFYNTNLDRLQKVSAFSKANIDLNLERKKRRLNPDSYDYSQYYDKRDESDSMYSPGQTKMWFKGKNEFGDRSRRLNQEQDQDKIIDKIDKSVENILKNQKSNVERKLKDMQKQQEYIQKLRQEVNELLQKKQKERKLREDIQKDDIIDKIYDDLNVITKKNRQKKLV